MDHGIADKRSAQVMERSVNELPKVKRHQEGEPVRVVPDLRESDPTE